MATTIIQSGWGEVAWGTAAWGTGQTLIYEPDGVSASGAVGTVTVLTETNAIVAVIGEEATGQTGTVNTLFDFAFSVTGEEATGATGSVQVNFGVSTIVTGEQASGSVGDVSVWYSTFYSPTSDVSAGSWTASTGTDLFAMVDEASRNDSDFIKSSNLPTNDATELAFGSITDPETSAPHRLEYAYGKASSEGTINLTVRLKQGVATIASNTHNGVSQSVIEGEFTLSEAQADSITNYSDLRVEFEADSV